MQRHSLTPLLVEDWVSWAGRVTVRRLREDAERALTLEETDPEAFRRGGGRPPAVCVDREIGALRGVHAGLLRCAGTAPDGLRWEMGIRPGVTPLLSYRSGGPSGSGDAPHSPGPEVR